ncbi:hypothetical protein [Natrialbaceae archaeon AArc-T1-2]|uniref:hypothetical protein n=1 Tax=Natrialbaceae archaeon AArc-T1-2 TaxID=3053904 RepID=UPI00255B05F8|nr:hypothetical protein [Natrialbaceae archaeon AArc-T1-2]WIV67096.1 hypothetical protein QQ977_15645 [Natrialbaceae archaeon AArc-T1-2]
MSDSPLSERALADTFDGGHYVDAWEAVEQYRSVMSYSSRHPTMGSSALAARFDDVPRGRIRTWLDGGSPDPVRAIDTAHEYGWLHAGFDDETFSGLNALVANVFSGGSIAGQYYQPSFALTQHGEQAHVIDALELAGIDYRIVDDRDGRADEARPTEDGTVLGRTLAALGAPVGPKAGKRLALPDYLEDAPDETRERFVHAYLENRAVEREGKDTLTVREERNREYLTSLADLIEDVADGPVRLGERDIIISADAARSLEGLVTQ